MILGPCHTGKLSFESDQKKTLKRTFQCDMSHFESFFKSPFHAVSKEKTFQCDMGLKFSFALACDIEYSRFIPAPPLLLVSHLRTAV